MIAPSSFSTRLQPLVTHKNKFGLSAKIVSLDEIYNGVHFPVEGRDNPEKIKYFVKNALEQWGTLYVLLVGDTPQIPTYTGTSSYSEADLYYVTVDGTDFIPDIYIGRFPGSQESHIEAMVDKTVYYEQGGFSSYEWIKKAAFIASSDHGQLAEQTHNYVIDNYLDPNGYTCDKIYEASGGNTQDILDSLEEKFLTK